MSEEKNLLEVSHLKQYFPVHQGFKTIPLKAVDDISFAIKPGETLGLVGESRDAARRPSAERCFVCTSRPPDASCSMVRCFLTAANSMMRMAS